MKFKLVNKLISCLNSKYRVAFLLLTVFNKNEVVYDFFVTNKSPGYMCSADLFVNVVQNCNSAMTQIVSL